MKSTGKKACNGKIEAYCLGVGENDGNIYGLLSDCKFVSLVKTDNTMNHVPRMLNEDAPDQCFPVCIGLHRPLYEDFFAVTFIDGDEKPNF